MPGVSLPRLSAIDRGDAPATRRARAGPNDVSDSDQVLRELSSRLGIVDWYWSHAGEQVHTTDETRRAMLGAFGIDASSEESLRDALAALKDHDAKRLIPRTRVVEIGDPSLTRIEVRTPGSRASGGPWRLEIH